MSCSICLSIHVCYLLRCVASQPVLMMGHVSWLWRPTFRYRGQTLLLLLLREECWGARGDPCRSRSRHLSLLQVAIRFLNTHPRPSDTPGTMGGAPGRVPRPTRLPDTCLLSFVALDVAGVGPPKTEPSYTSINNTQHQRLLVTSALSYASCTNIHTTTHAHQRHPCEYTRLPMTYVKIHSSQ